MTLRERMKTFAASDLYVVITEFFCNGRPGEAVLDAVLEAGVRVVQLREKELDDAALFRRACIFRERTAQAGALLIIDDRLDMALAVDADGVHLGQSDLPVEVARRLAPKMIVGTSTHNVEQAVRAQESGASYVNIGPIFPTQTKRGATRPVGLEMIDEVAPHLTIPWTTMGGIKLENVHHVLKRGARHIAVVTAVTAADDMAGAARAFRAAIAEHWAGR